MNFYFKKAQGGQSLVDMCLQEYGDLKALPLVLEDNGFATLAAPLRPGQELKFQNAPIESAKLNKSNLDKYRASNQLVNTQESAVFFPLPTLNVGYDIGLNQLRVEAEIINISPEVVRVYVLGEEVTNMQITNNLRFSRIDAYPSPALVAGNSYNIRVTIGYGEYETVLTV